ncbi:MAG: hypothetical protein JHC31_11370 [Sulfurihydrogenibium sp.]|jgi:hypothetical protein|nr:hypothetical protein [Sulfurihydrogenibium sp.]
MKEKKAKFVQTFRNISSIFVIRNNNDKKRYVREIKADEVVISGNKVQVSFLAPELDAYDLRTLIILLADVNMNKKALEIWEALGNGIELAKKLNFKIDPMKESDFSKIIRYETKWSDLLEKLGLAYQTRNIDRLKQTLKYLQSSLVTLTIKDEKTNRTKLELTSSLLMYQLDISPENNKNNRVFLVFNPLFYLIAFGKTILKSTINMEVFQKLFEKDANMSIVYYVLCDNVNFGEKKEFMLDDIEYACYGNVSSDKSTKSRRRKFLLDTLQEIEKLSNRSFIIKVMEDKIRVRRIPDRKNVKQES